jgi:hypothetical protein
MSIWIGVFCIIAALFAQLVIVFENKRLDADNKLALHICCSLYIIDGSYSLYGSC